MISEIQQGTKCFLDTETCGFHGMPVLIQYAIDDGPVHLWEPWKHTAFQTLCLLECIAEKELIGFNLAFDAFHLCKLLTVFRLLPAYEIPTIAQAEAVEEEAMDGPCWKPASACDLMLVGRKNQYQALMNRSDIRIRRVPTPLAYPLAELLEKRIEIPDIYFAKMRDKDTRWRVYDIEGDEYFKDVVLKFAAAGGLKYLAEHVLGEKPPFHFADIELDPSLRPDEVGYAPSARAAREAYPEGKAWPDVIHHHIHHWNSCEEAREYARLDVEYTRKLYYEFGSPAPGDDDSVLACMVAAVRWHGFKIDLDGIKELMQIAQAVVDASPINTNNHREVREYMLEVLDPVDALVILESTNKSVLEKITKWTDEDDNPEAAKRAQEVLDVKFAVKEVQLYKKLLLARRLHATMNVIGTKSSRMSGGGGLNVQGIKHAKYVRKCFPLIWGDMVLSGGDFDGYEVTLADAVYDDPDLRDSILSGKKIHGLFGTLLYPGNTYEQILASDGSDNDMYSKAKSGVFAMLFGGNAQTLSFNLGIPMDIAETAYDAWGKMFPGIGAARQRVEDAFQSMKQPGGIGTAIVWSDPEDFVTTKDGFKRFFTLENQVCKQLFKLAQAPPKEWRDEKIKVARRDRLQTASGATQSALYGAAFSIQSRNVRAAANHEIQSLGGTICKQVQRKAWDIQPSGIHEWRVAPLNVHDEILSVTHPDYVDKLAHVIEDAVESHREKVPLIGMTWNTHMQSWAEKKESEGATLKIGPKNDEARKTGSEDTESLDPVS